MITAQALATAGPTEPFRRVLIERRDPGPRDILVEIAYTGICHSDVHHARAEFGRSHFPMVPGHEIVGTVSAIGADVRRFDVGDVAGIGCMVDSCRTCEACRSGLEQYCRVGKVLTYNALDRAGQVTLGGYSRRIVVDEHFAVKVPPTDLPLQRIAPLLCSGITLYSPLRRWQAGPGRRVAIVGFGGLGHIGTQLARALGAHTTVLTLGEQHLDDALRLGADDYRTTTDPAAFNELSGSFDLVISTVPGSVDLDRFLDLLTIDGTLVNLGVPEKPLTVDPYSLFRNRRSLAGSLIGGMSETQELVDFCVANGIGAEVEVIGADEVDLGFDRVARSAARYRLVIDISTLDQPANT